MSMTDTQYSKCQSIIHTAAAASGAGKLVPVPFLGTSVNMGAMYLMAQELIDLFGEGNAYSTVTKSVAKGQAKKVAGKMAKDLVIEALKGSAVSNIAEEVLGIIPGLNIVGSAMAVRKVEKVGWKIAGDLYENNTSWWRKKWNNIWYHNEL